MTRAQDTRGEKIQKVLAAAGICSRRGAEELIRSGLVKVNGEVIDNPALRVDPERDSIEYEGRPVRAAASRAAGLILYKQAGYITSAADPHNRETVYHLLPEAERAHKWLYAGRLDKDTEGLLLFTDSGELVHRLTHPSYKVSKHYRVKVLGQPSAGELKKLVRGILVEGRRLRMDEARIIRTDAEGALVEVVLHQGEKRQIKVMFSELGHKVIALCRTRLGPLRLGGLRPGESRRLTERELDSLLEAVGLAVRE